MKPRTLTVLIDTSFMHALLDTAQEEHHAAVACYAHLIDESESNALRLVATSAAMATVPAEVRSGLLAPVSIRHVAPQHRRTARKVEASGVDADLAVTLVMLRREKIRTIAAYDPRLDAYALTNLAQLTSDEVDAVAGPADDPTEPLTDVDLASLDLGDQNSN